MTLVLLGSFEFAVSALAQDNSAPQRIDGNPARVFRKGCNALIIEGTIRMPCGQTGEFLSSKDLSFLGDGFEACGVAGMASHEAFVRYNLVPTDKYQAGVQSDAQPEGSGVRRTQTEEHGPVLGFRPITQVERHHGRIMRIIEDGKQRITPRVSRSDPGGVTGVENVGGTAEEMLNVGRNGMLRQFAEARNIREKDGEKFAVQGWFRCDSGHG